MADERILLVVTDEQDLLWPACRNLLEACSVTIRTASSSGEALDVAARHDLVGIVLKMSGSAQDRGRCLKVLAQKRPETPTILVADPAGHSSAVSIASPGIVDCLVEPVSPEDFTQALWRLLCRRDAFSASRFFSTGSAANISGTGSGECRFLRNAWARPVEHGMAFVGVVPSLANQCSAGSAGPSWVGDVCAPDRGYKSPKADLAAGGPLLHRGRGCELVLPAMLPRVGDVVYQGLPLCCMPAENSPRQLVASPLSGVVVAVNEALETEAELLPAEPCGRGWVALLCPTRSGTEMNRCRPRHVILVGGDSASTLRQASQLALLGCRVTVVRGWAQAVETLCDRNNTIIVLDAGSLGEKGPVIAAGLRSQVPEVRMIVVAPPGACFETEYRRLNVFFYAIEPFADGEIADILDAAFRQPVGAMEGCDLMPGQLCGIRVTNHDGRGVHLLVPGGLLQHDHALGVWLRRKLQDRLIPYETISGDAALGPAGIRDAMSKSRRLLVLVFKDIGRLPGTLVRDAKGEFAPLAADAAGRIINLVVQPAACDRSDGGLDGGMAESLAEHIVDEMTMNWRSPGRTAAASPVSRSGSSMTTAVQAGPAAPGK